MAEAGLRSSVLASRPVVAFVVDLPSALPLPAFQLATLPGHGAHVTVVESFTGRLVPTALHALPPHLRGLR